MLRCSPCLHPWFRLLISRGLTKMNPPCVSYHFARHSYHWWRPCMLTSEINVDFSPLSLVEYWKEAPYYSPPNCSMSFFYSFHSPTTTCATQPYTYGNTRETLHYSFEFVGQIPRSMEGQVTSASDRTLPRGLVCEKKQSSTVYPVWLKTAIQSGQGGYPGKIWCKTICDQICYFIQSG